MRPITVQANISGCTAGKRYTYKRRKTKLKAKEGGHKRVIQLHPFQCSL